MNPPIFRVRSALYKRSPKRGVAAAVLAHYLGSGLERMEVHYEEARVDVPSGCQRRVSLDNGRTWSAFEPMPPTLSHPAGIEVWAAPCNWFYDREAGVLLEAWLRQITERVGDHTQPAPPWLAPALEDAPEGASTRQVTHIAGRRYNCFTYYRLSRDLGRTWTPLRQLRYEDGAEFDPADPLKPGFLRRNQVYLGGFLRHSNGALIHPVVHANFPGDPENDSREWRRGALCFVGKWDAQAGEYRWTAGKPVAASPRTVSDGFDEPAIAELRDGRVLVIWRGTNTEETPGHKWFSISRDGGLTFDQPREWKYDDGTGFYSPASIHHLIRHSVTGNLYWIGNISAVLPRGNWPRYPLVIAEVDETIPALKRDTVTVIADRSPEQTAYVEFSNFSLLEDRETHEFEITLTAFGESRDHINNAHCYKYTLSFIA